MLEFNKLFTSKNPDAFHKYAMTRLCKKINNAISLWKYDRKLFYKRIRENISRLYEDLHGLFSSQPVAEGYSAVMQPVEKDARKHILIVFSFNPFNPSGMSTSTLLQCDMLKNKGYALDAIFYVMDFINQATKERLEAYFDNITLVRPHTADTSREKDGVTVHCLDNWCGQELLDAIADLLALHEYSAAIVHQPWLSLCLEALPLGVVKYLFMHDNYVSRAQLFESQGLPRKKAWLSISVEEQARCLGRADVIFAVQDVEKAAYEQQLAHDGHVITVGFPFADKSPLGRKRSASPSDKIVVGMLASANDNNRLAVEDFIRLWTAEPSLNEKMELHIAGPVCEFLEVPDTSVVLLGVLKDLDAFYASIDIAINPDCGGTGIKVKSLEAVSYGKPLVCSAVAGLGLHSTHPLHNLPDRPAILRALCTICSDTEQITALQETSVKLFADHRTRYDYAYLF